MADRSPRSGCALERRAGEMLATTERPRSQVGLLMTGFIADGLSRLIGRVNPYPLTLGADGHADLFPSGMASRRPFVVRIFELVP